ncbi:hypothetical protein NGRA_0213 [Nosema granulosis]|uniref:Uncharacterized protein n=1 Tax=Nosema granulosis TaxID=83296 RepID=A0A9P6H3Z9_9MICR|nr:hypothetical protein NGRA_0213 [Nosema granulosis]
MDKISIEELNSNLDYFIDVDVSKYNDELLSTLITCGRQECDIEKLRKLFEKLRFSEEEIKKYNLSEARNKILNKKKKKVSWSETLTEVTEIKRYKKIEQENVDNNVVVRNVDNNVVDSNVTYEYDLEKICENHLQIENTLKEILKDKNFIKYFA